MGKTTPKKSAGKAKPQRPKPTPKKTKRAEPTVVRANQPVKVAAKSTKKSTKKPPAAPPKRRNPAKPRRKAAATEINQLLTSVAQQRDQAFALELLTRASTLALASTEELRVRVRNACRYWASRELRDSAWEASLPFYQCGIATFVDGDDTEVVADLLNEYAYSLHQLRRLDEADAACLRALALHEAAERDSGIARVVYHQSGIVFDRGDLVRATELAQRSVDMARAAEDDQSVALHLYALSRSLFEQGKSAEAAIAAREGVELAATLGWQNLQGNLVNMVANIATEDGNLDEADAQYVRAIELFEATKLPIHAAITLSNRGNIAFDRGDNAVAIKQHTKAIKALVEQKDERSAAISLTSRAGVYIEVGKYAEAQHDYDAALEILVRIGQKRRVAFVRHGYAKLSETRGDLDDALAHYAETEMCLEDVGDNLQIARMLYAQLGLLAEVGDTGAAQMLLARADQIHSPADALHADELASASESTAPRRSHPGDKLSLELRSLACARIDIARARAGAGDAAALRDRARALVREAETIAKTNAEVRRIRKRILAYLDAN